MSSLLAGKRLVNTRATHQAAELDALLRGRGAEPLPYPCIAIVPPEDTTPLDDALRAACEGEFDWLVLTSANAALAVTGRVEALQLPSKKLKSMKVATVGPATAGAARDLLGVEVNLIPEQYVAEALAEALQPSLGTRILLPQSEIARPVLAQGLIAAGAAVAAVVAYRTVPGSGGADVPRLLSEGRVDAVTFTSPSTARNFVVRLVDEGGTLDDLDGVCVACIGPVTAEAVREYGLHVGVVPEDHTLEGILDGLEHYYSNPEIGAP